MDDSGRTESDDAEDGGARERMLAGVGCSADWWLVRSRCGVPSSTSPPSWIAVVTTRLPLGTGSWTPSITGSHCSGQATPSSFSTRSPARSVAAASSDALRPKPLAASSGTASAEYVVSKASCTAMKLRTPLSHS
eukprot:scaffold51924_cov87-Phaeocystis_antarctica.AAC.1